MTNEDAGCFLAALFLSFLCGVVFGGVIYRGMAVNATLNFREQAIERGYAQHNPKTGDWEWIEPTEKLDQSAEAK